MKNLMNPDEPEFEQENELELWQPIEPELEQSDDPELEITEDLIRKKKKIRILYSILGIFIIAAIVSATGLVYELYINYQGQTYYTDMTTYIQPRKHNPDNTGIATLSPDTPNTENNEDSDGIKGYDDAEMVKPSDPELSPWSPYVDFEALNESYSGISAWIKLENTVLNYPVMQWTDNYYFLGHLPDGTKHRSGAIFIDYRNNADFSDKNTLIYGHESKTGNMFGILKSYRKQSFYEENPVIYIYTPEKDYELVLFAGYLVDSGMESPPFNFENDIAFEDHVKTIMQRSLFTSSVEVSTDDRLVSLCTCAYDYPNARLVIVGKLVAFYE